MDSASHSISTSCSDAHKFVARVGGGRIVTVFGCTVAGGGTGDAFVPITDRGHTNSAYQECVARLRPL